MLRSLHGRTQRPHNLTLCAPWRCALLGSQMLVRLVALLVAVVATQADEAPTTTGTTGFLASALASMTEVVPASASTVGVLTSTQAACARYAGFVASAQRFDARAFGVTPAEARAMDPQQRRLLEHGYAALHAAARRRAGLLGGGSGVFLGIERPDWALTQPPTARASVYAATGQRRRKHVRVWVAMLFSGASRGRACSAVIARRTSAGRRRPRTHTRCPTLYAQVSHSRPATARTAFRTSLTLSASSTSTWMTGRKLRIKRAAFIARWPGRCRWRVVRGFILQNIHGKFFKPCAVADQVHRSRCRHHTRGDAPSVPLSVRGLRHCHNAHCALFHNRDFNAATNIGVRCKSLLQTGRDVLKSYEDNMDGTFSRLGAELEDRG